MEQLFSLCILLLAWYAIGRLLTGQLSLEPFGSQVLWSLAIGSAVGGMCLAWVGFLGGLNAGWIRIATYALAMSGLALVTRDCFWQPLPRFPRIPKLSALLILLAAGAVVASSWVVGLSPPTAGDALCYHLFLPKVFLSEGTLCYLPFTEESTYPLLTEVWFLWGLALGPESLPHAISLVLGLLLAGATTAIASQLMNRQEATVAGCLTLLVPAISVQCAVPLNDLSVAAFCTLGFAAYQKAQSSSAAWYWVSGLMLSAAGSMKYTAGLFFLAMAAAWLVIHAQCPQAYPLRLKRLVGIALLMLLLMGPWYLRSAYHTGNPVYPYLQSLFPGEAPEVLRDSKRPLSTSELATAPWQLTMFPENFGGRAHQLGFLPLALLPGVCLLPRKPLTIGMLVLCGGYFVMWYGLKQNTRFLLPIVPFLIVLCMLVWRETASRSRWLGLGFALVVLLSSSLNAGIAAQRILRHLPYFGQPEAYLEKYEPTYEIAKAVNQHLDQRSCVLSQELRLFYFDVPIWRESIVRRKLYPRATHWSEVRPALESVGVTHLLLVEILEGNHPGYERSLQQLLPPGAADDPNLVITETLHRDAEGVLRRYQLIELP